MLNYYRNIWKNLVNKINEWNLCKYTNKDLSDVLFNENLLHYAFFLYNCW